MSKEFVPPTKVLGMSRTFSLLMIKFAKNIFQKGEMLSNDFEIIGVKHI
jgi:hypothetical protein